MRKYIDSCDICESEKNVKPKNIQVIFTTDQTEGKNTEYYLSTETFDICKTCLAKILKGNYVYGSGAQGYNNYWFKKE